MTFSVYQIIVPLAAVVAVAYAWSLTYRQRKTIWEASLWTVFWCGIGAIALVPDLLDYLTRITGIHDRENAVLVTSMGLVFFVIFYIVVRLEQLEQRQTRMIRRVALDESRLNDSVKESVQTTPQTTISHEEQS